MRVCYPFLCLLSLIFILSACQDSNRLLFDNHSTPTPADLPAPAGHQVSFTKEVQPIIETKCLSCHSCFDAPCQLKLESVESLLRGASQEPVYSSTRTTEMKPTRLGMDELTIDGWRKRGSYSVLQSDKEHAQSLLKSMITLGKQYPFSPNSKLPDSIKTGFARENQCVSEEEFPDYAQDHPFERMPFGTSGLTDQEYALLAGWLNQGAAVTEEPVTLTLDEEQAIRTWETLFNRDDKRGRLVARWLYEHLFLAYLYFPEAGHEPRFFELLRSSTPPGKAVIPVATVSPNDDPGGPFFYRLRPISGTIVHKRRISELFFSEDWPVGDLPVRCLVPIYDGVLYDLLPTEEELWDRYYTGAPARQRRCVERYNIVKKA